METYLLEASSWKAAPPAPPFRMPWPPTTNTSPSRWPAGQVLLAGPVPQDPARGGILVVKTDDVAAFCQADPFVQRGVQRYDVIPFRVFDGQAAVKAWAE